MSTFDGPLVNLVLTYGVDCSTLEDCKSKEKSIKEHVLWMISVISAWPKEYKR